MKIAGHMIRHPRMGSTVKSCVEQIPAISLASSIQPITRTVLRVRLTIKPEFRWNDKVHGSTSEPWWIWVEDPDNNHIYHSEYFLLHKKQVCSSLSKNFCGAVVLDKKIGNWTQQWHTYQEGGRRRESPALSFCECSFLVFNTRPDTSPSKAS